MYSRVVGDKPIFALRGLEGLRVVDASVMSVIPTPNIHPAATIVIAKKGSDAIARSLVA